MLLSTIQAESYATSSALPTVSELDFTPSGSNNGVLLNDNPDRLIMPFVPPVGTTKIRVYVKKVSSPVNPVLGMFYDGSGSPQYGVIPNIAITFTSISYIETNTLPISGNGVINLIGQDILVDRVEFWNDTVAGTITIQNQNLTPVTPKTAGTTNNAISLTAPTLVSCADTTNRTLISVNTGITIKKGGVPMSAGQTFSSGDALTYDIAINIPTTTAYELFQYRAIGACGNSNDAIIYANVLGVTNSIVVQDQNLGSVTAGATGNAVLLTAPVTQNCADSSNRIVTGIEANIVLKKNNVPMAVNDTFTSGDTITYDIDNTVVTTTARNIFQYRAVGACGNSNVAYIKANVSSAVVINPSITVANETLSAANSGTSGNNVTLATPVVAGACNWAGTRRLTAIGVGITMKKNNVDMILTDTWMSTDIITYTIDSSVVTTTGYEVFRYKAIGTCGDSAEAIVSVNVTKQVATTTGGGGTFNTAPEPTPVLAATETKSSVTSWIIGGLFLVATAIVGFFLFRNKDKKEDQKAK